VFSIVSLILRVLGWLILALLGWLLFVETVGSHVSWLHYLLVFRQV